MSTEEKKQGEDAAILKQLGIKSANEATKILHTLLQDNVITLEQLKAIQKRKVKPNNNNSDRYMTRNIALRFHYDGATYNGLAQNVNSPTDNSVEKVLFAALQKTCLIESRETCGFSRSGRTDKGVSAFGQVVALKVKSAFPIGTSFQQQHNADGDDGTCPRVKSLMQEIDLPKNSMEKISCWVPPKPNKKKNSDDNTESKMVEKEMTERDFAQMINNVLPTTVRVLGWSPVTDEFSARFSTKSRTYRYFFARRDLDLDAMTRGLEFMTGRHDFRNLCKMNCEEVDNFERVVVYAKIVTACTSNDGSPYADYSAADDHGKQVDDGDGDGEDDDRYRQICYFEIQGQAFLWHQIRCIASVLFMIGKRLESPEVVQELLDIEKNPAKPFYPFAPDLPLVLHRCEYGNLRFGHSVDNLWRTCCDLESKWEELVLAAERLKNGVVSMRDEAEVHKDDVRQFVRIVLSEKRRKRDKRKDILQKGEDETLPEPKCNNDGTMIWRDALDYIYEHTGLRPNADGPTTVLVHVPLMQRGRGTTYEEKVNFILSNDTEHGKGPSKRKREAYEQNIVKKKVTKEEDRAFYQRMSMQGGSGI